MKILFAGTPAFAATHLNALIEAGRTPVAVITQPDRPGKRGRKPVPGPVKQLALAHNLTVIQSEPLSAAELLPFEPDLIVVVAYGQILRPDVLELPRYGCINVHASLLPRWRGAAPIQRAILAGDAETGVCTMRMDAGLDTGDVYLQKEIRIKPGDTTATLNDRLARLGAEALMESIDQIEHQQAAPTPQSGVGVTYAHKVDKNEARLDWTLDAEILDRQIRAFNPDPVAFTFIGDLRVKIWEAAVDAQNGAPGTILAADKHGIVVGCGTGSLRVTRLQLPVGKGTVLQAADVLNARGKDFSPGAQFK